VGGLPAAAEAQEASCDGAGTADESQDNGWVLWRIRASGLCAQGKGEGDQCFLQVHGVLEFLS